MGRSPDCPTDRTVVWAGRETRPQQRNFLRPIFLVVFMADLCVFTMALLGEAGTHYENQSVHGTVTIYYSVNPKAHRSPL